MPHHDDCRREISSLSPDSEEIIVCPKNRGQRMELGLADLVDGFDQTGVASRLIRMASQPPYSCVAKLLLDLDPMNTNLDAERIKEAWRLFSAEAKLGQTTAFTEGKKVAVDFAKDVGIQWAFYTYGPWVLFLLIVIWALVILGMLSWPAGLIWTVILLFLVWLFLVGLRNSVVSTAKIHTKRAVLIGKKFVEELKSDAKKTRCAAARAICHYAGEEYRCVEDL